MADWSIEVVEISGRLIHFYWGRHPGHANFDMRVGGGSHVIHQGGEAIVIDTMCLPGQGRWVRDYMAANHGVERFTVVNTHWHSDHVIDNDVYRNDRIVGHSVTRELLLVHKDSLENPRDDRHAAFPVVPPNVTFEGRLDLWLGDLKVELHEFAIHERGHVAAVIPDDKTIIAGDMLEDPISVLRFDHIPGATQLAEYRRMMALDLDHVYASHCDLDTVKAGGYDKRFIANMAGYMGDMLADAGATAKPAQDYIAAALEGGELTWWSAYEEVHDMNREAVRQAIT